MSEERKIRNDIIAIGLLAAIIFLIASLATFDQADPAFSASPLLNHIYQPDQLYYPANTEFSNACGRLGAWTADMLLNTLGLGAYFLVIGLIAMEIALFKRQSVPSPWLKTAGWTLSLLALTTLVSMIAPERLTSQLIGPGGYLGALGKGILGSQLGFAGSVIVAFTLFVAGMMMWTEYLVFRTGRIMFAPAVVAATSVLPFGIAHQFMHWVNGTNAGLAEDDIDEYDREEFEEEEDETPRTIRFRRRDMESADDELENDVAASNDVEEEIEDEQDNSTGEVEDEFEEVEEDLNTLKIASTAKQPDPTIEEGDEQDADESLVAKVASTVPKPHFKIRNPPKEKPPTEREIVMNELNEAVSVEDIEDYELPNIQLLTHGDSVPFERQKREALKKAEILERTCKEFNYDVKVVEIETGPVISQYEIELAPGLRLQKITALADDLAIAMRVPSVRIVAPIPGKNSVGVEVPNESRQVVKLRQVIEQSEKQINSMKIPLFLGADAVGAPLVADLAALPHLLIAGRTGTGKSVCLNAIISSILMTRRPDEVRMLMIDPKMVELSGYGRLPHLMHPVVTDMRKAEAILAWACEKMDERYTLLAKAGVRHVTSYNQLGEEELLERLQPENAEERAQIPSNLPFIVIVADEIADLMMTAGKEVEKHIIRLAQKSRAVGIHLILATQKPTVDVITGLIKSNLPARISFQVASKTDSRVVLDAQGADKLLGMGDMLFLWPGTSNLLRGQGTYLSDGEIDSIVETVSTGEQNFVNELVNLKIKTDEEEQDDQPKKLQNRDELYEQAITVIVREQRGSCSLLQRALEIGYGRAARLIDFMAEDGYVGPYNGSKAREVMLSEEQWLNIQAGDPDPVNDEDWPEAEETNSANAEVASEIAEPKVELKPKIQPKSKSNSSPQRKKLLRLEPGKQTQLSANISFAPKSKSKVKPEEEPQFEEELEEEEYEVEEDHEEYEDDEVEAVGDENLEFEDGDYEDADEDEYEDVEDDYEEE
ncbi:MAG: DNA translocase FtsK [Mariniblastus sp.]|nr:DNA translocase FtsK [Mariniblastus sp.]